METQQHFTIATRKAKPYLNILKRAINKKFPDPVFRLAKDEKKKSGSKQPNLENAYGMYKLLQPPFSMSIMTRLSDLDPYLAGAVDAIAVNVSACDMELKWTGDGEENEKERKELEEFFFDSNDPTNPMSLNEKIKACTVDFIELGSWNLEIVEGGSRNLDLIHAPAEFVRVKKDISGYMMVKNNEKVDFALYGDEKREEGTHQILRAINKQPGHRVYGKPMIYSLVNTVLINSLRDEKNLKWFDQGVLADLLILVEEIIGDGIKEQIVADYQNTSDGEETMYILDGVGKSTIEQITRTLEDKSQEALEGNGRQRVLSTLRVPPAKVAIYEDANRANSLTQDETFRNEVTKPIQDKFRFRFDHIIKYGFKYDNWKFVFKPLSLKDRKEEAEIHEIYGKLGAENVDEIREAALNKPQVKGGSRRVMNTPLGLVDLDTWEIAVADPSKTPETVERLARNESINLVMRLVELRKELQRHGIREN